MKKYAFTLAEILIVVTIIGIIAVMVLMNLDATKLRKDGYILQARKALNTFNQAMAEISGLERDGQCPSGEFIVDVAGVPEFGITKEDGTTADAEAVMELFSNYIRFDETGFDFCDNSGACDDDTTGVAGAKMAGGVYVGIQMEGEEGNVTIHDCPRYTLPGDEDLEENKVNTKFSNKKCWGYLLVDVNGKEGPNEIGKDFFKFNLDDSGVQN